MKREGVEEISRETLDKENALIKRLQSLQNVLLAFSGGTDSAYLMAVAREALGEKCRAVFVRSALVSSREEEEALNLGRRYDWPLELLETDLLALKEVRENLNDRCYHCKKKIFEAIIDHVRQTSDFRTYGSESEAALIEGTNASDAGEYRPGRKALQELGILSPLLEAGLTKKEIRALSKARDLPTWDKPAMACLATRIPFGELISAELLQKIERAEAGLREKGYPECRVRAHGEIARIEIPEAVLPAFLEIREDVTLALASLGFRYITLDLSGLRSGSLNPVKQEDLG